MPESRQVGSAASGSNTLWCSVDFQTRTQIFDLAGPVGPQGVVRVGRHDDVLQAPHSGHEPAQLRAGVDRFDFRKGRAFVVGFGHERFHASMRSSVVVIVASSDSVLSMIEVA
jgi:hypothetical protein